MRKACMLLVIGSVSLGACESRTELMRRYQSVEGAYPGNVETAGVDVGVFSIALPGGAPRGVLDLSDRAQEKFIEIVGENASVRELGAALATPFRAPVPPSGDAGRIARRLVLSVIDRDFGPADRLDRLELTIRLKNDASPQGGNCGTGPGQESCLDASFTGWTLFETRYDTVDLGKATAKQSTSLEGTIGLLPTQVAEITSLSITPKVSRDLSEELNVRRRYVTLAGELSPTKLRVLQQGVTGIDLVGTSQIDVTIDLGQREPGRRYRFTTDKAGTTSLTSYTQLQPQLVCDLEATLEGRYRIRSVGPKSGDDTSVEGDDRVRYLSKSFSRVEPVLLVSARDIGNPGFVILLSGGREMQVLRPSRADHDANYEPLHFADLDEAVAFVQWLRAQKPSSIAGLSLGGHRFRILTRRSLVRSPVTAGDVLEASAVSAERGKCSKP